MKTERTQIFIFKSSVNICVFIRVHLWLKSNIELLISAFGVAVYPPGASFGPRTLRDFEFVWMLEGDAQYSRENEGENTTIAAPAGTLILCRPAARDSFRWDAQKRTRHAFFHFKIRRNSEKWASFASWPITRPIGDDTVLAPLFRHILTWRGAGDALQRELAATLLLRAFVTGETSIGDLTPAPLPELLERAYRFLFARLDENPAAPIALENLAKAAFVTPEHLCRVFKSATGRTPLETVRLARLDRAAVLLSRSNYAVSQVAKLSGFASPFHFSRAFKAEYGVSPRDLRASLERGEMMPLPRLLHNPFQGEI